MKRNKPIALLLSAVMTAAAVPFLWAQPAKADIVQYGWGVITTRFDKQVEIKLMTTEYWTLDSNGVLTYQLNDEAGAFPAPPEGADPLNFSVANVKDQVKEVKIIGDKLDFSLDTVHAELTDQVYDHYIQWDALNGSEASAPVEGGFAPTTYDNVTKVTIDAPCFFSPMNFPNAEIVVNDDCVLMLNNDYDFDQGGAKLKLSGSLDKVLALDIGGANYADNIIDATFLAQFTGLRYLFMINACVPAGITLGKTVYHADLRVHDTPSVTVPEDTEGVWLYWYPNEEGHRITLNLPKTGITWSIDGVFDAIDMYYNGTESEFYTVYPDFHYSGNWEFHFTDSNSSSSNPKDQIKKFIERIYTNVLDRAPEEGGVNYWTDELYNFNRTGAEVAQGFIFSEEFTSRNLPDAAYIRVLYSTFFGRDFDDAGMNYWLEQLSTCMTREEVAYAFIYSQEWADTCATYGIKSGGDTKATKVIAPTDLTNAFVERMYTTAMGREYDKNGRDYWAAELANFNITGEAVGASFFLSEEMASFNLSDAEFVNRLYKTFMDRESDADGAAYWLGLLASGTPRADVVYGFTRSPEFTEKCVEARILPF